VLGVPKAATSKSKGERLIIVPSVISLETTRDGVEVVARALPRAIA